MPRFKVYDTLQKKMLKSPSSELKNLSKSSIEWYKRKIGTAFNKKIVTKGKEWEAQEVEIDNKTVVDKKTVPVNKIQKNLNKNTTLDATFKKNVKQTKRPLIGHMYFYIYDPKWKKILPYYDVFPLTIPIEYYNDGFLGLNLHYLPYILRAKLLDALFSFRESSKNASGKIVENNFMSVSYKILKASKANKYFKPTIKRYLYGHVKSPFAEVLPGEWENAAFLPVEQFRKANKREVWVDSKANI